MINVSVASAAGISSRVASDESPQTPLFSSKHRFQVWNLSHNQAARSTTDRRNHSSVHRDKRSCSTLLFTEQIKIPGCCTDKLAKNHKREAFDSRLEPFLTLSDAVHFLHHLVTMKKTSLLIPDSSESSSLAVAAASSIRV